MIVQYSVHPWIRHFYALSTSISANCACETAGAQGCYSCSPCWPTHVAWQIPIIRETPLQTTSETCAAVVPFWNANEKNHSVTEWMNAVNYTTFEIWPNLQHSPGTGGKNELKSSVCNATQRGIHVERRGTFPHSGAYLQYTSNPLSKAWVLLPSQFRLRHLQTKSRGRGSGLRKC